MRKIVLIACGKTKLVHAASAGELYTGALFRKSMAYARKLHPDAIYILSAKHGLLDPGQVIEPYEATLNGAGVSVQHAWASRVLRSLGEKTNLSVDLYILLAGDNYCKYLIRSISHYERPLKGKRLGEQQQELDRCIHE